MAVKETYLQFNGSAYVDFGSADNCKTGTGKFTYLAWVQTSDTTQRKQILSIGNLNTGEGAWFFISGNRLEFDLSNQAGPVSSVTISDGEWHCVAVRYDGTYIYLYIDNVEVTYAPALMYPNINGGDCFCGKGISSYGWNFIGNIDEVRVCNDDIGTSGISAYWNGGQGTESAVGNEVGWWHFNENTGTTAYDSSGNSYDGTIYGATWYTGMIVYANLFSLISYLPRPITTAIGLEFNGTNYVDVGSDNSINLTGNPMSIAAWFWMDNKTAENPIIMSADDGGYFLSLYAGGGNLAFGQKGVNTYTGNSPISTGGWHFGVVTYDTNYIAFYLDGNVDGAQTASPSFTSGHTYKIGSSFKGTIDEVLIFDRILSSAEVTALWNNGLGLEGDITQSPWNSGLVGGWHLDEKTGTTTADFSGNGNTGTLTNSPHWYAGKLPSSFPSATIVQATAFAILSSLKSPAENYDYKLSVTAQSISTSLKSPAENYDYKLLTNALNLSLSEPAPQVNYDYRISVSSQGLTSTLHNPVEKYDYKITTSVLDITSELKIPVANYDYKISVSAQGLTLTLQPPVEKYDYKLSVSAQTLSLNLISPVENFDYKYVSTAQALSLDLQTPLVKWGGKFIASVLPLALTEHSPIINYDYVVGVSALALLSSLKSPAIIIVAGRTYLLYGSDRISFVVRGNEMARFKLNGDLDLHGVVNNNAF